MQLEIHIHTLCMVQNSTHWVFCMDHTDDLNTHTHTLLALPVEEISQSSHTTAGHAGPKELVDSCRSVQIHLQPLCDRNNSTGSTGSTGRSQPVDWERLKTSFRGIKN